MRNRYLVVAGAVAIQVALGAIYAWSAFTKGLQSESAFGFSKTQTQAIFAAGLASFGITMIPAGRLQQRYPPRYIAMAGGMLLGGGYILGGLAGTSFVGKLFFIGVVAGAGIGLAYVVPIAVGVKWFPDRKGLLTGLAVAGFGFGAFLWILMANPPSVLADGGLIEINTVNLYDSDGVTLLGTYDRYDVDNINQVFIYYGAAFMVLVLAGSWVMVPPPEGWLPTGYIPLEPVMETDTKPEGTSGSREMLHSWQFWVLWSMFVCGALAGLMVIGNIQNFAKDPEDGFASNAADIAVIGAAVCLPIFNGLGRIVWGSVSDKIGRQRAFTFMFAAQFVAMLVFFYTTTNQYAFYLLAALIGFNFGGNFALFPAATADYFGAENVGPNYGLVFTSYAVGGIVGPILAGMVKDAGLSYYWAFVPAALMCLVAASISLTLGAPGAECGQRTVRIDLGGHFRHSRPPQPRTGGP